MPLADALPAATTHGLLAGALAYLRGRQCRAGGFCFYRSQYLEEPNLLDTWHALAAYDLLGQRVPRRGALDTWLDGFDPAALHHPRVLGYWALSKRLLAPAWQPSPQLLGRILAIPLDPPSDREDPSGWLARTLEAARLQARFTGLGPRPALAAAVRAWHRGGYGPKPNLQDTARALALLALLGEPDRGESTARFVESLQDPQLGFCNTLDSRYVRLDVLLAGVQSCRLLGLPIRYPEVGLSLVRAAQTAEGAFADVPGALPTLQSHYTGVALVVACRAAEAFAHYPEWVPQAAWTA